MYNQSKTPIGVRVEKQMERNSIRENRAIKLQKSGKSSQSPSYNSFNPGSTNKINSTKNRTIRNVAIALGIIAILAAGPVKNSIETNQNIRNIKTTAGEEALVDYRYFDNGSYRLDYETKEDAIQAVANLTQDEELNKMLQEKDYMSGKVYIDENIPWMRISPESYGSKLTAASGIDGEDIWKVEYFANKDLTKGIAMN